MLTLLVLEIIRKASWRADTPEHYLNCSSSISLINSWKLATAMALHVGGPLGFEASTPEKYRQSDLPPKQYAEAVVNNIHNGDSLESLNSIESGDYTGSGEAIPPSPKKWGLKRPSSKDLKTKAEEQKIEHQFYRNGSDLTSTSADADYKESLKLDEKERKSTQKKPGQELVSGRQAGAGWERSG